jgi:hypothetical protein
VGPASDRLSLTASRRAGAIWRCGSSPLEALRCSTRFIRREHALPTSTECERREATLPQECGTSQTFAIGVIMCLCLGAGTVHSQPEPCASQAESAATGRLTEVDSQRLPACGCQQPGSDPCGAGARLGETLAFIDGELSKSNMSSRSLAFASRAVRCAFAVNRFSISARIEVWSPTV